MINVSHRSTLSRWRRRRLLASILCIMPFTTALADVEISAHASDVTSESVSHQLCVSATQSNVVSARLFLESSAIPLGFTTTEAANYLAGVLRGVGSSCTQNPAIQLPVATEPPCIPRQSDVRSFDCPVQPRDCEAQFLAVEAARAQLATAEATLVATNEKIGRAKTRVERATRKLRSATESLQFDCRRGYSQPHLLAICQDPERDLPRMLNGSQWIRRAIYTSQSDLVAAQKGLKVANELKLPLDAKWIADELIAQTMRAALSVRQSELVVCLGQ